MLNPEHHKTGHGSKVVPKSDPSTWNQRGKTLAPGLY
jgi:hypothetical protein